MDYCRIGEKAEVIYSFKGGKSTTYESSNSPIEVTTGTTSQNTSLNYNPEGYQITFNSPQAQYGTLTLIVVDYQITFLNRGVFDSDTGYYIKVIPCGETSFPPDNNGIPGTKMSNQNVTINSAIKCPVASENHQLCNIKILNNGSVIFQAQGDCPVSFTVACGDECPDGYCKIECETYPGYCCINEAEIKSLSNQLNS